MTTWRLLGSAALLIASMAVALHASGVSGALAALLLAGAAVVLVPEL